MPENQYKHERSNDVGRRSTDCPPEGCTPVVLLGSKLTWVLWAVCGFGTLISSLLTTQTLVQLPAIRQEMNDRFASQNARVVSLESHIDNDKREFQEIRDNISEVEGFIYKNSRQIKALSNRRPTIIHTRQYIEIPIIKEHPVTPPAKGQELWNQK